MVTRTDLPRTATPPAADAAVNEGIDAAGSIATGRWSTRCAKRAHLPAAAIGRRQPLVETSPPHLRQVRITGFVAAALSSAAQTPSALPANAATVVRGAKKVADETGFFAHRTRAAAVPPIDGAPRVVAPHARFRIALRVVIDGERIVEPDAIGGPARLACGSP